MTTTNPMFAVTQALAAALSAGVNTQSDGLDDLATADFVKRLAKMLNSFKGDMKALQAYLKNYLAYHEDAAVQKSANTGSALSLKATGEMLTNVQSLEARKAELQKKLDDLQKKVIDTLNDIARLFNDLGVDNLEELGTASGMAKVVWKMGKQWLWLGPGIASAIVVGKAFAMKTEIENLQAKAESLKADASETKNLLESIQKEQLACTVGTSGSFDSRSADLSGRGQEMIDTVKHLLSLSFGLLDNIDGKRKK